MSEAYRPSSRSSTASDDRADVLVIGAGAAGAAVAWMLARAGVGVSASSRATGSTHARLPHWRADWELHRHTDWSAEPNVRRLPQDYPVNDAGSPIVPLMYNAVGGSTIHWSAHFPRFRPSDFRVRSLDGVADDWPIDYATLEPFFDLNDRMMGVAGIAGDPAYPPKPPRQTPPIPLDTLGATMARGFDRLGWHWWPSDSAILTRDYDGRRACINCGPVRSRLPDRGQGEHRPHVLAQGAGRRRAPPDARSRARDHAGPGRARRRRPLLRPRRAPPGAAGAGSGPGRQRDRHAAAPAELPLGALPERARQSQRARGPEPHVPSLRDGARRLRSAARRVPRPHRRSLISQEFYETDLSRGFVRGYSSQVARGLSPIASALGGSSATACRGAASTVAPTTSASTARSPSR